jgi:hypothetical protein
VIEADQGGLCHHRPSLGRNVQNPLRWLLASRFGFIRGWQTNAHIGYRKVLGQVLPIRRQEPTDSFAIGDQSLEHGARDRVQVV